MADFVLIHGAWHGAWCWQRVLGPLREAGHRVFAVTLSGVGERAHFEAAKATLSNHIDDILAVVEAEELARPILVGHSYGGLPMTGAADALAGRVRHLVYLDAVVPLPGECWSSQHPAPARDARRAAIAATGFIPPPDASVFGLTGADHAWVTRRMTPQPGAMYDTPLDFDAARWAALPRTFIDCTAPALPAIDAMRARVRSQPGWRVHDIATGHDAMVSAPADIVRILSALA